MMWKEMKQECCLVATMNTIMGKDEAVLAGWFALPAARSPEPGGNDLAISETSGT